MMPRRTSCGGSHPRLTAQRSSCLWLCISHPPRMATDTPGQEAEPHCPDPQSPSPGSGPQGPRSTFFPSALFLPRLLGRNGCPVVPLPFSSVTAWTREPESLGEPGSRGGQLPPSHGGTEFWAQTPAIASWGAPSCFPFFPSVLY